MNDRLVLRASNAPSFQAVILPPAFEGAYFCFYLIGPPVGGGGPPYGQLCNQRVVALLPTWENVKTTINWPLDFFVKRGDHYEPITLEFDDLPKAPPFTGPGAGWIAARTEKGAHYSIRRAPLMRHKVELLVHPYSYAYATRNEPDDRVFVNPVASPEHDARLKEIDFKALLPKLHDAESSHPEGFLLKSN